MIPASELYRFFQAHPHVSTDTRKLPPGCLFFALKGETFDGNQFAVAALNQGAAYAIVDDPAVASAHPNCLLVENTLIALQQLATIYRDSFNIPVVAIGGSNGKTTTKELVAAVLSSRYRCHATSGNLNNHIGVPLTLLSMPTNTEIAVIEAGANKAGEIEALCQIAKPTHGLITNIGKEHLEGFGSLQGVKKAEGELYQYLKKTGGYAFINLSEKYLATMAKSNPLKIFYQRSDFPSHNPESFQVECREDIPFVRAAFIDESNKKFEVETHLYGIHNFQNIMTAIALGLYFKIPGENIQAALAGYRPANNRSQRLSKGSTTVLLDAYNANPSSMEAALDSLKALESPHKVAILGDMLEMGQESYKEHLSLLKKIARLGLDTVVVVGPEFAACNPHLFNALSFPDALAAHSWFQYQNFENTTILIKGSRGIKLERVLEGW